MESVYASPITFRVIISRRMRWTVHVTRMRRRRSVYMVLVGNVKERDHLGDPGVDGRIILRWIFENAMWGY